MTRRPRSRPVKGYGSSQSCPLVGMNMHVTRISSQKGKGSEPVGYSGQAALRREKCDMRPIAK
jgi:hypothetical protein